MKSEPRALKVSRPELFGFVTEWSVRRL